MNTFFNHRVVAVAVLLLASIGAHATLKPVEQAYELSLSQVTLPASDAGSLIVRPCASCKPAVLRVNSATRYVLRPAVEPVTRSEFAAGIAELASRTKAVIFVFYEPQSGQVRRVVLQPHP
jgi:hypothetical protein